MLLRIGSRGIYVKQLQERLGLTADGVFGPATEAAVREYQQKNGLAADGIVGNMTWGKIFEAGNFGELAQGDLGDDTDEDTDDNEESDENAEFAEVDGLKLDQLKGQIPDPVIGQISQCATTFKINSRLRLAHFLAQCDHESAGFKFTTENLNYSASGLQKIFGKYFPGTLENQYARQPEKIASRVYANRMGNGDEASKDGWNYRGRGYIQLTGKDNYKAFHASVDDDILGQPDLVATKYPLLSAAWFWNSRSLNTVADQGATDATVTAVTKKVNGGTIGLAERIRLFKKYYALLA
jgi:putative chitinase